MAQSRLGGGGRLTIRFQAVGAISGMTFRLAQPERDMGRLHRLVDDGQQVLAYLLQVYFTLQRGAEGRQRLLGIILAAIEAAINEDLDALAHWQEERGNRQRGDDQHHRLLVGLAAGNRPGQAFQPDDEARVERAQQAVSRP